MFYEYVFLLMLLAKISFSISVTPILDLPYGIIRGRQALTVANTVYYAFQQIPYAAPPIGNLRFKAPQPPLAWLGIRDATYLDTSCIQMPSTDTDSEDCLFLNVYTPRIPVVNGDEKLPVMLFIHGGSFTSGSSMIYPPDLFVDNDVILVTINYRLGIYGFLSTEDDVIPGNNALKDQRLAIQWVHDNIEIFAGDPEKITIFGESAGSAAVAFQLLNQDSDGLFRAAILESGTFLSPWAYQRNARNVAFSLATVLNPVFQTNNNSQDLLQFLQSVGTTYLNAAVEYFQTIATYPWYYNNPYGLLWAPVIETKNPDAFITKKMYGLLEAGNILKVPTLIGLNSEESLLFNTDPVILKLNLGYLDINLDLLVPEDMRIADYNQRKEMGVLIRDIYTDGQQLASGLGNGIRVFSDNAFTRSIIKHAELVSKFTETYFYQFSYDGPPGGVSIHYDGAESVGHAEDLFYLFCTGMYCDLSYSKSDEITQKRLIKLWTDFAKYLNPTPEPSELLQNVTWPAVSTENGDFLYLDIGKNLEVKNHPKKDTYRKWTDLYDSLGYSDFDTY